MKAHPLMIIIITIIIIYYIIFAVVTIDNNIRKVSIAFAADTASNIY